MGVISLLKKCVYFGKFSFENIAKTVMKQLHFCLFVQIIVDTLVNV